MATVDEITREIARLKDRVANLESLKGLDRLRAIRGMAARVARGLGVSQAAVSKWPEVPAERVLTVARITGIPRGELRPDLYPDE